MAQPIILIRFAGLQGMPKGGEALLKVLHAVVDVLGIGALILVIVAVVRVTAIILGKRFTKPNESQDISWDDEQQLLLDEYYLAQDKKIKPTK